MTVVPFGPRGAGSRMTEPERETLVAELAAARARIAMLERTLLATLRENASSRDRARALEAELARLTGSGAADTVARGSQGD